MARFPAIPNPKTFLLEVPLYKRFKANFQKILELRDFSDTLDFYCIECGENSIFKRFDTRPSTLMAQMATPFGGIEHPPFFDMQFVCSRGNHKAVFYFKADDSSICKVGEFPSKVDIFSKGIIGYKKILGNEYMSLQKAKELYSQGIGAGAFVYLRRIFENVIVKRVAIRKYSESPDWDFSTWKEKHKTMDRKLKDVSTHLPSFINNQELFRVLSAAVHELDETTCLQFFTTVEMAITEILDDEISIAKKQETRKILNHEIKKMDRDLKK